MLYRVVVLSLLLAACAFDAPAQQNIGITAVVKDEVTGVLGPQQRLLAKGDQVFAAERVSTTPVSSSQLLFVDETTLTVGPSSSIVLDEFVYTGASRGKVVMTMSRGVARFVTGVLQSSDYEIRTPTATIGVRGTAFDVHVADDGETTVVLRTGEVIVRQLGAPPEQAVTHNEPGRAVTLGRNRPPHRPGPVPPEAAGPLSRLPALQDYASLARPPQHRADRTRADRPPLPPNTMAEAHNEPAKNKKRACRPGPPGTSAPPHCK